MAITAGTVLPFTAWSGAKSSGQSPNDIISLPMTDTVAYQAGDIITLTSGKATVLNTDPASADIVGICYDTKAAVASCGDGDLVQVIPATGQLFEGSLVTDSTTDLTNPAYATHIGTEYGTVEDTDTGFPLIDISEVGTTVVKIVAFSRSQLRGQTFTSGSSGTSNPRVIFMFL